MKDEWREFKYDLASWKKVPEELKTKTKRDHGQSKSCTEGTTATSGMLQAKEQAKEKSQKLRRDTNRQQNGVCKRLIILKQGLQFELLPLIAEIASSLPMSNVWPERGAS